MYRITTIWRLTSLFQAFGGWLFDSYDFFCVSLSAPYIGKVPGKRLEMHVYAPVRSLSMCVYIAEDFGVEVSDVTCKDSMLHMLHGIPLTIVHV